MRSRGSELLRLTQAELGALFGPRRPCPAASICAWETGSTRPTRRRRGRMELLSNGFIRAAAWDQPPEAQPVAQESLLAGEAPSPIQPSRPRAGWRAARRPPGVEVLEGQTSFFDLIAVGGAWRMMSAR